MARDSPLPCASAMTLLRGQEDKAELAKALELQMHELAHARQADALRSSHELQVTRRRRPKLARLL